MPSDKQTETTHDIPDDWYVCFLGKDEDGLFVAQLRLKDSECQNFMISDVPMTFVSRTGNTWQEAMMRAISEIEKMEATDA